ncbi:protein AGENET DOMAIN (AGD)-CONTAINING P1-like [Vicia villosa]|uniref:protein AGENET DOMAIN (AGD)-CONTAINING P1-like n=1 Tax=Vicia villosa TaxID=3911 RepID=UPI00273BB9DA|nr:protein AGENET DOMAIN (AGD)-CONTAINING P1-like [Vicia villosa]
MASKSTASSSSAAPTIFQPGTLVEISINEAGFRGSWFTGKIVRRLGGHNFVVEFDKIMVDEKGTKGLQETVDRSQLRPIPPKEIIQDFQPGAGVDAYYNDGWWEGIYAGSLEDGRSMVCFRDSSQAYPDNELRLHHDWVDGSWIPPFPQQDESEIKKKVRVKAFETVTEDNVDFRFKPGTLVEVCSDEDGLKGVWFCATLVEPKPGCKFVVEYESLIEDDYLKPLREEVSLYQIRPRPPKTDDVDQFKFFDEVDAYYKDGWWVGIVSKVLGDSKYIVYFRNSNEEMEFQHSQLRLHQDWVDHQWVMASKCVGLHIVTIAFMI